MSVVLSEHLPLLASAPDGIQKLRGLILELAVRGKLVPQEPGDEPARALFKRIVQERARLEAEGICKKPKLLPSASSGEFYSLPKSWQWSALDPLVRVMDSGWSPACIETPSPSSDVWGVLKTTAVQTFQYLEYENKELPAHLKPRPECEVEAGDILITRAGPKNRVAISCLVETTRPRLMISDKIIRFHLVEGGMYEKFVALCLNSGATATYLESAKSGMASSQMNITQEKLRAAPIPLCSTAEQHRIVAKVDELMALCDRLEVEQADAASAHARLVETLLGTLTQSTDAADLAANWQRLAEHSDTLFTTEACIDALKQTVLQLAVMGKLVPQHPNDEPASELVKRIAQERARLEADGARKKSKTIAPVGEDERPFDAPEPWQWHRLDELFTITGGITLGRKLSGRLLISRPYLRVANVQRGHLLLDHMKTIEIPADELGKYRLQLNDLLITEGGDWDKVGRAAIWRCEVDECLHQNHVFRARPLTDEWNCRWTEIYLNATPARNYFAASSKQTTNLASINMTQLKALPFPVPPLAEQYRIVAKVDELMALCDRLKADLATARQHQALLADTLIDAALEAA